MKRLIFLALALMLFTAGCSGAETPAATPTGEPTPTPAGLTEEGEIIICKINEATLYRSQFEPVFNMYYQYYGMLGYDLSSEAMIKQLQDSVFDNLVRAEVIRQQAEKEGITLSAAEEEEIQASVLQEYEGFIEQFKTYAEQEGAADTAARAKELLEEALAVDGMTIESYRERSASEMRKSRAADKLYEKVIADVSFTGQDAPAVFEQDVAAAKEKYEAQPSLYATDLSAYQQSGGVPPLYIPEGYVRVKHILMNEEETAQLVYKKLKEGQDFDALMEEYGADPGMKREPDMTTGYLMNEDTNFVPEFKEAGLKLTTVGEYTEPVRSSHGWHIIRLEDKLVNGPLAYEEMKETYIPGKLAQLQSEHYAQLLQSWIDESEIVSYIGRIRDLGKAE